MNSDSDYLTARSDSASTTREVGSALDWYSCQGTPMPVSPWTQIPQVVAITDDDTVQIVNGWDCFDDDADDEALIRDYILTKHLHASLLAELLETESPNNTPPGLVRIAPIPSTARMGLGR